MSVPLEGSLATRDFPTLVASIYEDDWTGTISLTHMGVCKSVVAQSGRLIWASSTSRDDRLGDVLLRQGKITLHQYTEAGKAMGGGKRLGTLLVEHGALSPKDLVNGVVEQTREIIFGVFQWTEGRYKMVPDQIPTEAITLKISTGELALEGIRRIESWSRIEAAVGGLEARYELMPLGTEAASRASLSAEKTALVGALVGIKTVDEICSGSTLSHFEVCRTLWAFQVIGVVRRVDIPVAQEAEAEDEGLGSVLTQE
jgi:Domain of unknown function (DUF4388)